MPANFSLYKLYLFLLLLISFSCKRELSPEKKRMIWDAMRTDSRHKIIAAVEEIRKSKDTSMLDALLYKSDDPRVSNSLNYKGKSIYQMKMEGVKGITGIKPPVKITWEVDTSVISYYRRALSISDTSTYH